jgi:Raf kinase inhibitor-like YbhB/YbcL family protein
LLPPGKPLESPLLSCYNRLMELTSAGFRDGEAIPRRYTCEGEDRSPPLAWSGLPQGTASLALIVDDPDAPGGLFTHWLAWAIDPAAGGVGEGEPARREGRCDFGTIGYRGPCPPRGHGPHRYVFRLLALAREPGLPTGASRAELERAIAGHVLGSAELVGSYQRR